MLRQVRDQVVYLAKSVQHDQVPALYDQTIGEFHFKPGKPVLEPVPIVTSNVSHKPALSAVVRLHELPIMEAQTIEFKGNPGSPGRIGQNGSSGTNGQSSSIGLGGAGAAGIDGMHGSPGGDGLKGPNVQVLAHEVRTLDGDRRLLLIEATSSDQTPRYFLRPLNAPPLRIATMGGVGGDGGNGGNGGNGGHGGDGKFGGGSGGRGGNGSNGGIGGNGGSGGKLIILVSNPDLQTALFPVSVGGEGGRGGGFGQGGKGGSAGSILAPPPNKKSGGWFSSSESTAIPLAATGSEGSQGAYGLDGVPGKRGDDGIVEIRVDEKAADVLRRVPKNLIEQVFD
jgi:hypothetical protein